jgi:hypothetical protein
MRRPWEPETELSLTMILAAGYYDSGEDTLGEDTLGEGAPG